MTDLAALNIHFAPEEFAARRQAALALMQAVSYTHLTLPTILRV